MKIAFVYPGVGAQWKRMGAGLLEEDVFREAIRRCDALLSRCVDWQVEEELQKPAEVSRLEEPSLGYLCSLVVEIALTDYLKTRGLEPDAVVGHSGGEAAAAYQAGILTLEDMLQLLWNHSILMQKEKNGAMAHIGLPREKVLEILGNQVFIAAHNSPKAVIVSGEKKATRELVQSLSKQNIFCKMLRIATPFHSPLIQRYKNEFYKGIKGIRTGKAALPIYSALHGGLVPENGYSPSSWTELMIKPVNFTGAVRAMIDHGYELFLEISPHPVLTQNIKEILAEQGKDKEAALGTLKRDEDEKQELLACFDRLNQFCLRRPGGSFEKPPPGPPQNFLLGEEKLELIRQSIREVLKKKDIPLEDPHLGFFAIGFDSLTAVKLSESLSRRLGLSLPATLIFDYPDISSLTHYLTHYLARNLARNLATTTEYKPAEIEIEREVSGKQIPNEPIAVIGMACRFPGGANSLDSFWDLLKNGKNTVTAIPPERWDGDAYYSDTLTPGKSITKQGNFISGVDIAGFDAGFFRISPKEARSLDPQQRLLLEVTVEALENAGIPLLSIRDQAVGVFIGMCMDDYKKAHLFSPDLKNIDPYSGTGSMSGPASGRISYFLGIRGPSMVMDTACSSTLAALHTAVQSLRGGECDMALVGGVNCLLSPHMFVYLSQLNTLSRDGTCKTFAENADGFGRGEGCGVVVLTRESIARQQNHTLWALVKGTAVNHDGASIGFTAPNGLAQQEVIKRALENAGVLAESIDYIETHGAGTPLGDPIEIEALRETYGKSRTLDNPLLVGSVKTNIGHLEGAAGAAGLIKTILALHHQTLPPHLYSSPLNPLIPWEQIPVKITAGLRPWQGRETPRRAGVSGFGFSGSNAHIILEEPPQNENHPVPSRPPLHLLTLSARTSGVLAELVRAYRSYLSRPTPDLHDLCFTASTGRSHYPYRYSILGKTRQDILAKLEPIKNFDQTFLKVWPPAGPPEASNQRIVFLFTGQGSQYTGMAASLYNREPVFKAQLDICDRLFSTHIETSIIRLLYSRDVKAETLDEAIYAQPIIFSIQYALSKLWQSWGVGPALVIGHSIGEYAAACLAGVLSLEDAVKLVAIRGRLMQSVKEPGCMVGILTSEEKARSFIRPYPDVSIAAVNAPANVTISGSKSSVEKVLREIKQAKIFIQPLNISHAFHSTLMEPYAAAFAREIAGTGFSSPRLPIISTITARSADRELCDPEYWSRHFCRTVRFLDSIKLAWEQGYQVYIEIGATAALAGLASQGLPAAPEGKSPALVLPSLRKGRDDYAQLLTALSHLYSRGIDIDWQAFYRPFPGKKVLIPTYPFQRERYWHESLDNAPPAPVSPGSARESKRTKGENENNDMIKSELKEMITAVSGLSPGDLPEETDLFSLGLDSLMLVELRRKINGQYGIDITLNEFFMELTTLNKIARHIRDKQPPVKEAVGEDRAPAPGGEGTALERLLAQQLEAMNLHSQRLAELAARQLEMLKLPGGSFEKPPVAASGPPQKVLLKPLNFAKAADLGQRKLTAAQQRHLEALIRRYTQRTRASKQQTRAYRQVLADSKASVGFHPATKELLYPITGKRARGSRIWDIDGNEYVDITMGFGVYLFGHHPSFVSEALRGLDPDSTELGPRSYLAGEAAERISRLTGLERVTFANTGTEAVMTAIRLARAATGRTRIAMFSRSYHGHSDATLAVSFNKNGKIRSEPVSPGIPQEVVDNVMVLEYLDPRSLEILEKHSHQLAAVLVEPVQGRYPAVQPGEFLRHLRQITQSSGTLLIFDEMITGFRLHPGGAQAYFNVEADICTYGKIIGGGLPIGVIAGKRPYLDHIDGGYWDYGDASYPQVERTFFGGTFCQYHEAMAAACAVLKYLEAQGPGLQDRLNQRTQHFADTLNAYFKETGTSMRVAHFSSIFRFDIPGGMDLFYYHLLEKGVYIWEWRNCFLSTAHTDEDLDRIIVAVKESIDDLDSGGFFLKRTPVSNTFPMSSVQKRLYVLSQKEDGQRAYHMPMAMRIEGPLDVERIEGIFKGLIQRHHILRTGLEIKEGQWVQRLAANEEVEFSIIYKKQADPDIEPLIDEILQPFNLSKPPLMRVSITEISPRRFIFLTNFHHAVVDGVSLNILVQDFMALYRGDELPPVKKQYADYVHWEQQYLDSPRFRAHEQYWTGQLGGRVPVLELPFDFPRPHTPDFSGQTLKFKINEQTVQQVKQLARRTGTSLNMLLLAIFDTLLSRLSGQEDTWVGIPVSVKEQEDFQDTVGMFTNTLVIRSHPRGSQPFALFLQEVKLACLQAYAHQEYPFEALADKLASRENTADNPLFDVAFVYENGNQRLYKLPGLVFTSCDVNLKASAFQLIFEIIEEGGGFNLGIGFRTRLWREETITRWEQYFERLMAEVLNNPETRLSDLEMLSEAEKQMLLWKFNNTRTDYPRDKTLHQLVAQQVEQSPDHTILVGKLQNTIHLTYSVLNKKSVQLAGLLQQKGVKAGTLVAIMIERSVEMVIGLVAILKAGAAYLPIDPGNPGERTNYMLADSKASLLTIKNFDQTFLKVWPPAGPPEAASLAYIMYTSGSTGAPKAVMVEHTNVIRLVKNTDYLCFKESHWILPTGPLAFDASTFEIWGALLNRGRLVLVSKEDIITPGSLGQLIPLHRITTMWMTAPLFNQVVEGEIQCFAHLRYLLVGGAVLSPPHINRVRKRYPDLKILNGYGPTENTTFSTTFSIEREYEGRIPIGKPLANSTAYIIDSSGHLVPIGVPGELVVGGDGVARGYLNNPELTAQRFVTNFNRSYKSYRSYILYKTGDRARWLSDGNIEFLGRIDRQVKIRGFRIEPGEIESRLLQQEEIKEAAVISRADERGDRYLCAYFTTDGTNEPGIVQLREHLAKTLPGYMIPAFFVRLEKIPLTSNGKIDREALPAPVKERAAAPTYTPPRNDMEKKLVSLWAGVLNLLPQALGIDENFFHRGGHSLKGTLLAAEIEKEFKVKFPLSALFQAPTVRTAAAFIGQAQQQISEEIEPVEKKEYYPLSSAQKRLFFLDQWENIGTSYNITEVIKIEGNLDKERLEKAFQLLIRRHESLRTSFGFVKSLPVQRIHDQVEFQIEDFLATGGKERKIGSWEVRKIGREDDKTHALPKSQELRAKSYLHSFIRPFDLSSAPLLRTGLRPFPGNRPGAYLFFDMHHIVGDGTSMGILFADLATLYNSGPARQLPLLHIQYKDFTQWQNRLFATGKIKEQEEYWLNLFPDPAGIPLLKLPTDYPRPETLSFAGDLYEFILDTRDTAALASFTAANGVTLYMSLMAAFNVLLHKYAGQSDIIVGTAIMGRRHHSLDSISGMFVNSLAMRNWPEPDKAFRQFLAEVKENSIKAFENQDLQFEELVDKLGLERTPSRNPLFDVVFVVQNFQEPQIEIGDVTFTPCREYENNVSKFDITLYAHEVDDQLLFYLEYSTRLFKRTTIELFARRYLEILRQAVRHKEIKCRDIEILTAEEKKQLLVDFNDTQTAYPYDKSIPQLFAEQVGKAPHHIALRFENQSLTYRELDRRANRLANYLYHETGVRPNHRVGLLMERSLDLIPAILGILKAGGAYVPFDTSFPAERIKLMINDSQAGVLISRKKYLRTLNRLQWECPSFHTFICLDSRDIDSEREEEKSQLMERKLWEYVGETAVDEITAGGWLSSYTGEPIPAAEMAEYGDNILKKLTPLLRPRLKVLEIGCASGISMFRLAPRVGLYWGTDLSQVIISKNKQKVEKEGHENIVLSCLPAHELDRLPEENFDLVIINSVIQCFHGHHYLKKVIRKAIAKIGTKGWLFIGDVMNQELKTELIRDLENFKQTHLHHPNREGPYRYKTKTDWSTELFISPLFFQDLQLDIPQIREIEVSDKIHTIENELTKYRYDTLLSIDKSEPGPARPKGRIRHKHQHDSRKLHQYGSQPLNPGLKPDDLAYIIYTSGTTGRPRGILTRHTNVLPAAKDTNYIRLTGSDRVLQLSNYAFDGSVFDIFAALLNGSRLVLLNHQDVLALDRLAALVQREQITVFFVTTALFNTITDLELTCLKHVRKVLFGGERVSPEHTLKALQYLGRDKIIHVYGPSETTVYATYYRVDAIQADQHTIPIGKPLANTCAYILDKALQLVPIGIPGELFISGNGVALGYLNCPELTQERFLAVYNRSHRSYRSYFSKNNPLPLAHNTFYKTGDLTRWLFSGDIEFIGRIDNQVKIRGFRIELEEIEKHLLKHPEIKETTVMVRKDPGGADYLCAYVVALSSANQGGTGALERSKPGEFLAKELPGFMIPAYFVELTTIPLTANGKIDRKALPEPLAHNTPAAGYTGPENRLQEQLAAIWSEVLNIDKNHLSIDANFFEIGGHSLKATVLMHKIHQEMNTRVTLTQIFKNPTLRGLARQIGRTGQESFIAIKPAEKKEYYELSPSQKRLYILQQMEAVYNMNAAWLLTGVWEKEKLQDTCKKLIHRHESLRTSFRMIDNQPVQVIHDSVPFEIEFYNPGREASRQKGNKETTIKNFLRPFDLACAPLLRTGLIKIDRQQHILVLDLHHIISDGISLGIFIKEFTALYETRDLPGLRLQYKDYAEWRQSESQQEDIKKQGQYWLRQFAAEMPVLELPLDYPRPGFQDFTGHTIDFQVIREETAALKTLANNRDATLYMVLLAAFQVLLAKLSGSEDLAVGTPVAGRRHPDFQPLIGMFVGTLVMRNYPAHDKTAAQFIREVKERALAAFENQDYPFENLVEKVVVERDTGRNPLFDVMFALQNIDLPAFEIQGLTLQPYDYESGVANFDLFLQVFETREILTFSLNYCTKLFKEETIKRFIAYFKQILSFLVETPHSLNKKIAEIEMIPAQEKRNLLVDFNNSRSDYPCRQTIHGLFAKQAGIIPDHVALMGPKLQITNYEESGEVQLSYKELNENTHQWALRLQENGVQPGTLVGIMAHRSAAMVIGILAILKAGAAYLPIDPTYPQNRIDFMLKDSNTKILVKDHNLSSWPDSASQALINLSAGHLFNFPTSPLPHFPTSRPSSLAYLIYTSGSTGNPRGVMVNHRSVVNLLFALHRQYSLKQGETYLLKTSFAFDVSVSELFGWFLGKSRLVILETDGEKSPGRILGAIEFYGVTHINFVPSMFHAFVETLTPRDTGKLSPLEYIFLAGEELLPEWVVKFRRLNTGIRLENLYGPTEATVYATKYKLSGWKVSDRIPIGKPLPNTRIYILSRHGLPQGIGIPGEMVIAGAGVSRGYLNRPELTAEKFISIFNRSYKSYRSYISKDNPLPLTLTANTLYTTGDLARWLVDGNIQFLGRLDRQVKIRGFRIELAEIENRLLGHPQVKAAAVTVIETRAGDKNLAAYIVTAAKIEEIKMYLSGKLPGFMIPAFFIPLENLPLTASGKLDTKALPAPGAAALSGGTFTPPRDQREERLAALWAEILGIEAKTIGIDSHFFQSGGHSLAALRLIARIHKEYNTLIPMKVLFKFPTLRGLSRYIENAVKEEYISTVPAEKREYYPVSSIQKRLFILDRLGDLKTAYNLPHAVIITGEGLDLRRFRKILQSLMQRHESLRTSLLMLENGPVQRVHDTVDFSLDYEEVGEGESEIQHLILEFIRPFDLGKAPLLRAKLVKFSPGKYLFLYDMHHIISDGTSLGIFLKDFMGLYRGEELPGIRIQYKDVCQGRNINPKQENYWLDRFKGQIPKLGLFTDFPRPQVQSFAGDQVEFRFENQLYHRVQRLSQETGTTLYMILLAFYTLLLARYTGQEDIIVGTPASGREQVEVEPVMGLFMNPLAMRNYPGGSKTFREFLAEVKQTTLAAYENQGYPFGDLVEKLALSDDLSRNPIYEAELLVQNMEVPRWKLEKLTVTPYEFVFPAAQMDLALVVEEADETLFFNLTYSTALYKKSTVERLIESFREIAAKILDNPGIKLADLKISHHLVSTRSDIYRENRGDFEF